MSPIYAARIALVKAEATWRAVDRDLSSSMDQRRAAREAYEKAKSDYRAAFKKVGLEEKAPGIRE